MRFLLRCAVLRRRRPAMALHLQPLDGDRPDASDGASSQLTRQHPWRSPGASRPAATPSPAYHPAHVIQQPVADWYMDTCTTTCMSADAGTLHSLSPHPIYGYVIIWQWSSIPSPHLANSPFLCLNRSLHLRHDLLTPSIIQNLISFDNLQLIIIV